MTDAVQPDAARGRFTRRHLLGSAAVAGLAWTVGSFNPIHSAHEPVAPLGPMIPKLRIMRDVTAAPCRQRALTVAQGGLVRKAARKEDQFTFAVDVGQLLCYFASIGDLEPYLALRDFAEAELVANFKDDPFTRGFVLWRCQPGAKPDASGTTEALCIAKGLWTGARTLNRPQDRALALDILDGYSRHQTVDQNIWIIRNYFLFAARWFASNSFIIDYDADFVREVADALVSNPGLDPRSVDLGKRLSDLADKSYEVMRASVAPCGLLYDLVQPELATMYYGINVAYFSPNDVIQLNNACMTAATCTRGDPEIAKRVLAFITDRLQKLYAHYYGRTGEPVNDMGIGATEYLAIIRLALLCNDQYVIARCIEQAMPSWEWVVGHAKDQDAWTVSEMLLGLHALVEGT